VDTAPQGVAGPRLVLEKEFWLGCLFLGAGLTLLMVAYLTHRWDGMETIFDSDSLFLPSLYKDLFLHGGHLKEWRLPPAPLFFPEWPLFFSIYTLVPNLYWTVAVFFVVQISLAFLVLAWLNRIFLDKSKAFLFAGMSLLALCYLCLRSEDPFTYLAMSQHHIMTFLAGLVVVRLATMVILKTEVRVNKAHLFLIFVLCLLVALSDAIFLIYFCAPLVVASAYLWGKCVVPWRRALVVAAMTATGTASGIALYGRLGLLRGGYSRDVDSRVLSMHASQIKAFFLDFWHTQPVWFTLCALVWAALFCMWALVDKLQEFGHPLSGSSKFLIAFCLAAAGLVFASCWVSTAAFAERYFIPVFFIPMFIAPYGFLAIRPSWLRTAAICVCMAGVCAAGIRCLASSPDPLSFHSDYYPEDIKCMDAAFQKFGLVNGIAQYWDARTTALLAKTPVNITQVSNRLALFFWNTSLRTFRYSYDFAIINPDAPRPFYRLDEGLIKAINGEPTATVLCGQKKVLVYPRDGLRLPWRDKPQVEISVH
jgi:hypothetical protein